MGQMRQRMRPRLAGFPWRFCLVAAAMTAVLALRPTAPMGHAAHAALSGWLHLGGRLLLIYAALKMAGWLLLELPEQLGLWRGPSKILRDLLLLLIGAAITVVLVQQHRQVNLVGLVTTSAVLTAVVGLAAQETLKDLFAGITLQLDPPFREGDWIDLGDVRGTVTQLSLMNTNLSAMDGSQIVLSNSTVAQATLRRFSPGQAVGNRLSIGLDYALPPSEALALLREVLRLHPDVLNQPAPQAWVGAYHDSSISYEILAFQAEAGDRRSYELRSSLLEQIWYALERSGQTLPFPVREIRRRREGQGPASIDWSQSGVEHKVELLGSNPLLKQLRLDQRQRLAALTRCLRFAAGEVVVREGDPGNALYQVISGSVEVLKRNAPGAPLQVATLGKGDVFGEMTLCTDEPRNATVQTVEPTVLLEVERGDLLPLIASDPALLERIARLVAARRSQLERLTQEESRSITDTLLRRMQQLFHGLGVQND